MAAKAFGRASRLGLLLGALTSACGESDPEPSSRPHPAPSVAEAPTSPVEARATPETPRTSTETAPTSTTEEAPLLDDSLTAPVREGEVAEAFPSPLTIPSVAAGRCAERTEVPLRIAREAGAPALTAVDQTFFAAAYTPEESGESLSVFSFVPGQAALPVQAWPIALPSHARSAPPALVPLGRKLGVGYVDGEGNVFFIEVDPARPSARPIAVGEHADARFAPAIALFGTTRVVAYSEFHEGAPHLRIVRLDASGTVLGRHEATSEQGGAAHPSFVVQRAPSADLLFLDARRSLSILHRVSFDSSGIPGTPRVARPLSATADPPDFVGVEAVDMHALAYTAVGNMATRAVGLVSLGESGEAPVAVVPGLGYGQALRVSAIAREHDAVIATEAPSAVPATAPHEVRIRTLAPDASGHMQLGEPLVIEGRTQPSIAMNDADVIAVAVSGGLVHFVLCP